MDLLRLRREGIEPPGHAVVEAGTDGDDQIGAVHRHIGFVGAVHAEHPEPVGMIGGEGAQTHQRAGDGSTCRLLELAQQIRGARAGIDDPAAGVEHRALRRRKHVDGFCDLIGLGQRPGPIAGRRKRLFLPLRLDQRDLHILGDVDQHRAGPSGGGDAKGFLDRRGEPGGVLHEVIVLGAMASDADRVGFLKGIGADQPGGDLAGDDHHRDGIHPGIGDPCDRIGRPGAAGDQYHAGLAGGAGVTLRSMRRAGLVADEDVAQAGVGEQLVVDRQHRAARVAENEFDLLRRETIDQYLRAVALDSHGFLQWFCARRFGR